MDERRHEGVDQRLPDDVVGQRLVRVAIDQRQMIRDQHRLAEDQGGNGGVA
jgi:hypothetical protein